MAIKPSIEFIPEGIRAQELYPKVCSMVDYIVRNFETELEDVRFKYRGPDVVREEVIKQIINELGFDYISSVMDTITNFEFNQLLQFLSLINLYKGHRSGLELVLKLLGFDSITTEWWENNPQGPIMTFDLTVIVNSSYVTDLQKTVDRVKVFTRHYVYPVLNNVDFRFSLTLAEKNVIMAGFVRSRYTGTIMQRI
jgi:hypothetical protein